MTEDILIKFILGEATVTERLEVEAWKADSSANFKKFEEIQLILETSNRLAKVSPLSEAEAWEKFKQIRLQAEQEPIKIVKLKIHYNWLRIAASIIFLIGGSWVIYYLFYGTKDANKQFVNIKATNKVLIDTLPDGSIVHINKNSSIAYHSNFKLQRIVKLNGEAFFNVRHNEAAPFSVQVNDIQILDVGTAFNVKSKDRHTEIIVESGIVNVAKNKNSVRLYARQMVRIKPGDHVFKVETNNDLLYSYYVSNTFAASKTPLWRLVEVLNEAYNSHIHIENHSLLNVPITITIRVQDSLNNILKLIKETTPGMQVDSANNIIIIR